MSFFHRNAEKLVDWYTRPKSVAAMFISAGIGLVALTVGPGLWALVITGSLPSGFGLWSTEFGQQPLSQIGVLSGLLFGIGFLVCGTYLLVQDRQLEQRQRVLVVEVLGLRNTTAPPLVDAVPKSIRGIRNSILMDLRQNIVDGEIYQPRRALEQLTTLPDQLRHQCIGLDRRDVRVVAGGLAPVPFLFLAGLLIDDESEVHFLDWDRHATTWRELTGIESHLVFLSANLADQAQHTEVALCVSVSYRVNVKAVSEFGYPIVHLELPHRGTDAHWCEADQNRWVQTFLGLLMELEASGVRQIHLFLSAPGSVVLRLGRAYDRRNLPAVRVYQHERVGDRSSYPWAVEMPVSGRSQPTFTISDIELIGGADAETPTLDSTNSI